MKLRISPLKIYPFVGLLLVLMFPVNLQAQSLINEAHVKRQPYHKLYIRNANPDTATCYISEYQRNEKLPLIVFIQDAGRQSLFSENQEGVITPNYGHTTLVNLAGNKAKLLIVEKPGISFLNANKPREYDEAFSLETWTEKIKLAIRYVCLKESIDTRNIMLIGHSEGSFVAAVVAKAMPDTISHVTLLGGDGTSQLFSAYTGTEEGNDTTAQSDFLKQVWEEISADPLSVKKKFLAFTYLRWSSFMKTSISEALTDFPGKILYIQGTKVKGITPESAVLLYETLLSKGKDIRLEMMEGADEGFFIAGSSRDGWEWALQKSLDWFLPQ